MPHLHSISFFPPPQGLLYREGLARFCTVKYKGANHTDDRSKPESSHLTNYSLSKKSLHFKEGQTKRLLSVTLNQLAKRYAEFSIPDFWDAMEVGVLLDFGRRGVLHTRLLGRDRVDFGRRERSSPYPTSGTR